MEVHIYSSVNAKTKQTSDMCVKQVTCETKI